MSALHDPRTVPAVTFAVDGCESVPFAAAPTLSFAVRLEAGDGVAIRSVLLDVQIQIAARRRGYDAAAQDRLLELFGPPEGWGTTLRTLPWLRTTTVVPAFTGSTVIGLPVACTYDLEVSGARYFAALQDGKVPLEFLFSGTVFYTAPGGGLQAGRISWNGDVDYEMPVAAWRGALERHFPGCAWLRLGADSYGRLCAYKARHAHVSFDAALDALLASDREARP